jgi:hypothetical protein
MKKCGNEVRKKKGGGILRQIFSNESERRKDFYNILEGLLP